MIVKVAVKLVNHSHNPWSKNVRSMPAMYISLVSTAIFTPTLTKQTRHEHQLLGDLHWNSATLLNKGKVSSPPEVAVLKPAVCGHCKLARNHQSTQYKTHHSNQQTPAHNFALNCNWMPLPCEDWHDTALQCHEVLNINLTLFWMIKNSLGLKVHL